ncbi:hypothetical protein U9M48_017351 [Paspalum notatum var. saurae]|uniref:Uncharacterized protein n=1 Tax=Paspalum notatum var. saurae TaxID=547442 RepID=A0AAQ3WNI5_PASNO
MMLLQAHGLIGASEDKVKLALAPSIPALKLGPGNKLSPNIKVPAASAPAPSPTPMLGYGGGKKLEFEVGGGRIRMDMSTNPWALSDFFLLSWKLAVSSISLCCSSPCTNLSKYSSILITATPWRCSLRKMGSLLYTSTVSAICCRLLRSCSSTETENFMPQLGSELPDASTLVQYLLLGSTHATENHCGLSSDDLRPRPRAEITQNSTNVFAICVRKTEELVGW